MALSERLEDRTLLSSVVTNTNDSGDGSLRQAILDSNASSGHDTITFDIPGGGAQVIAPLSALPAITDSVTIDGSSEPGYAGTPVIELDGTSAGTGSVDGLFVAAVSNTTIRALDVRSFSGTGINIQGASSLVRSTGIVVEDCYLGVDATGTLGEGNAVGLQVVYANDVRIANNVASGNAEFGLGLGGNVNVVLVGNRVGTNAAGTAAIGNGGEGILMGGVSDCTIGGLNPGDGNVISGTLATGYAGENGPAGRGIWMFEISNVVIQGNRIGTDITGTVALGNAYGGIVAGFVSGPLTIGGTDMAARNIISGNSSYGVIVDSDFQTVVQGNYIGTNASGKAALANGVGILAVGGGTVVLGGTTPGAGNLISGNGAGAELLNAGNIVQGNFIGTNAAGTCAIANGDGIYVGGANNLIGGGTAGAGNLISGNTHGIYFASGNGGNAVQGNLIGTDVTGTASLGNFMGVLLGTAGNLIGTNGDGLDDAAEKNVISGSSFAGLYFLAPGGRDNVIAGNYIGTDVTGTASLGNVYGLLINTAGNRIGTNGDGVNDAAERNIISGSSAAGIAFGTADAHDNVVAGNYVGSDFTGTAPLANARGVYILNGAYENRIGTDGNGIGDASEANVIAFNIDDGITVLDAATFGNSIRGNSIYANAGLGIDLGDDGVTPNDPNDADSGPNGLQNFPVLTLVEAGATTRVVGTFQGAANAALTIDFYSNLPSDPFGYGQGRKYLGSSVVATDGSGNATFDVILAASTSVGSVISATATDAAGDTSEFSLDLTAVAAVNPIGILLLDTSGSGALTDSGNGSVIVGASSVIAVASTSSTAVVVSGHGNVKAGKLDLVSATGTQVSGNGHITAQIGHSVPLAEVADPLASLAAPTPPSTTFAAVNASGNGPLTLQPGTYTGGIKVSGNRSVTLQPGIYYLQGGGFQISGNASVTGTGVMIYNAPQSGADLISLSGNASVFLSALTSGAYKGIVLFQSRTSSNPVTVSGNGGFSLTGTLYAAKARISLSGNAPLALTGSGAELIAADLSVTGNGSATVNPNGGSGGGGALVIANGSVDPSQIGSLLDTTGGLAAGMLTIAVDGNSDDVVTDEELRIDDAIAGLDEELAPYGVSLVQVFGTLADSADIHLHLADTSAIGGVAQGVLGLTVGGRDITLITGWNWYTDADPSAIGADEYDFQTVATHELGHALGLRHSPDAASVMYPVLAAGTTRRDLSAADLAVLDDDAQNTPEPLLAAPAAAGEGLPADSIAAANSAAAARAFLMSWDAAMHNPVASNATPDAGLSSRIAMDESRATIPADSGSADDSEGPDSERRSFTAADRPVRGQGADRQDRLTSEPADARWAAQLDTIFSDGLDFLFSDGVGG